jgi:hypothetical protein
VREPKKLDELMLALGFRKDAPESTVQAFVSNLIRSSSGTPGNQKAALKSADAQLSFSFDSIESIDEHEASLLDTDRRHSG